MQPEHDAGQGDQADEGDQQRGEDRVVGQCYERERRGMERVAGGETVFIQRRYADLALI